ncbi:MAG: type III-A CRISPR-associated RAMP protein Csm4 [Synergistetes bacterium]|nr:type III-A CRISPR-associated RAMP protein Csm4 [Synergistota bacterium]
MIIFKLLPGERTVLSWKDLSFDSASLFGAISNAIFELYGEKELNAFFDTFKAGEISISSIFPMILHKGVEIFFFPRPILAFKRKEGKRESGEGIDRKKVKRVKWLSLKVFEKFLSTIERDEDGKYHHSCELGKYKIFWGEKFCSFEDELPKEVLEGPPRFNVMEVPHVSIDRLTYSSNLLFFIEGIFVRSPLAFFFLCECSSTEWKRKLESSIRFLADEGFGGGRNERKGIFAHVEIEEKEIFKEVENPLGYVGLSLVYPDRKELDKLVSFLLVKKDGFVYAGGGRSLKKSRLMMLSEGCFYSGKVKGLLLEEEGKSFGVFRNGMAFLIPAGGRK